MVFDKSLGDFDGEIGRERDTMAKTGKGSGRAAEGREAGDAGAVKGAQGGAGSGQSSRGGGSSLPGGGIGGVGGIGDVGGIGGPAGSGNPAGSASKRVPNGAGSGPDAGKAAGSGGEGTSGDQAGAGEGKTGASNRGGDVEKSEVDGAKVAKVPSDIPADPSGEDPVARQLREAAMAEEDPKIREALWDQYRKQMGIRKK